MLKKILSVILSVAAVSGSFVTYAEGEVKYITLTADKEARFEAEDYAVINNSWVIGNEPSLFPEIDSDYIYVPATVEANLGFNLEGDPGHYYNLDVKDEGMYDVWVYVCAQDTGRRAFNYNFDGAVFGLREADYEPPGWRWMLIGTKFLSKGKHTLGFIHRHRLTPFDKFIITAQPDFSPEGKPVSAPEFLPETGESADLYFNLPPVVPPANQHPRLLIDDERLEEIRANLNHEQNASVYQNVLKRAAIETDGKFAPMTASSSANISYEVCDVILSNAFLYILNGDVKSGEKAISIAKNALMTAEGKGQGADAFTRQGGHLMFVSACTYDWCYDLLDDSEKEFLRKYMYRVASFMEVGYPKTHPGNIHGHNVEMQIWKDMMSMAIAIYDEDPKMYNNIGGRVFEQMIPIRNEINKSIFFSEGPTYGPMRFTCGLFTAYYMKAMGYGNVFGPQQQTALYGQLYRRRPDGQMLNNSDNANEDLYGFTTGGGGEYMLCGNLYDDQILKREYWRTLKFGNSSTVDGLGPNAVMHLIVNNTDIDVNKQHIELPLTTFSPDGTMVARTSWNEGMDSDCVLVQMNTKEKFYGMHDHMDIGHFDIYYKGTLAVDSGLYESDPFIDQDGNLVSSNLTHGSKHWYGYSRRAIAHNVMLVKDPSETKYEIYNKIYINDGGQKDEGEGGNYEDLDNYNVAEMTAADFGPDLHKPAYSYLKGDLKGAYTDKIKEYDRSFMFLNLFDEKYPAALIILDSIESSNADFEKAWLLHSEEEPEVNGNVTTIRRADLGYNGRLINESLLPEKVKIEKIGGDGHEFEYNGYNYGAATKSRTQEAGKWRIEVSPEESNNKDYFLNVMQMSDNDDSIEPLKTELIRNDTYVGVKIKDRAVFLRKDKKITISDTVLSAEGDGNIMFIVDGMREGKWNVYDKNNKKIAETFVEKEHHVVSFEAPAGEYKLVWEYVAAIPAKDYSIFGNIRETEPQAVDVQIDKIYESFKNKIYTENDEIYLSLEELLNKVHITYTENNGVYTLEDEKETVINVPENRVKSEETTDLKKGFKTKDGVVYVPLTEFCGAMGYTCEWDKVGEVVFISSGTDLVSKMKLLNSTAPDRIRIRTVTCSSAPYSSPYDLVDGNLGSYWGGQGDGEWIMFEFEKPSTIAAADIKWHTGDQRSSKFDLLVSEDNENWITVYQGTSDGVSKAFERTVIKQPGEFKYLKIVGHGNSMNDWNSISEVKLYNSIN